MKKAFDQTVRDLKREVNKKVLKAPKIEQKVLDATSNESWGPHGTLLADIAQASRNNHEYQIIMAVMWKRINDTGKNWRHVYKALTVLEYLVAHGTERVIDEIREHAYQIQTLSDFQYIDSNGRDQGSNVRKKSQGLVALVNDKERIQEVREKAAANRDKFRTSASAVHRPGGGYGDRYDDDRYGSRDEDRNGNGRERDDGRYGDQYGDRYEDRYSRDDQYRGRRRDVDDYQYGSRSRSSERYKERAYEDDGHYSSRGSEAKADDQSQDGSVSGTRSDQKYSEQNAGAPPSYEEAVGATRSPTLSERDGEASSAAAPKPSSPPASTSPSQTSGADAPPTLSASVSPTQATSAAAPPPYPASQPAPAVGNHEADVFDEFDPRGPFLDAPTTSNGAATTSGGAEMDLFGFSDSFGVNSLALVPVTSDADPLTNVASVAPNQAFDDPFGDGPFRAIPSTEGLPAQQQTFTSGPSFQPASNQVLEQPQQVPHNAETINTSAETYHGATYNTPFGASNAPLPSTNAQYSQHELSTSDQSIDDILADILPPTGPQHLANSQPEYPTSVNQPVPQPSFHSQSGATAYQTDFPAQHGQPASLTGYPDQSGQFMAQMNFPAQPVSQAGYSTQSGQPPSMTGFPAQASQTGFPTHTAQPAYASGFPTQLGQAGFQNLPSGQPQQPNAISYGSYNLQPGSAAPVGQLPPQVPSGPSAQQNAMNFLPKSSSGTPVGSDMSLALVGSNAPVSSQPTRSASTGSLPQFTQPAKEFETKSTVWTDTLSRGLVNLNISGPKANPNSDIGVDFDALNRKDKRMEKPSAAPVISTITMGKAMGSGSGVGRSGAGSIRPSPNSMVGSGMGMGMGGGPRPGIGMGGYGGMNQPGGFGMGMNAPSNMGIGMNVPPNMGMGMSAPPNMGMGMNAQSNMGMGMNAQQHNMGMGMHAPPNMGMGMNAQSNMGMGMNMPPNMGMGMNNMGMGGQVQQPGFPPGSTMPGGYNPTNGTGNYNQQQYGGGYR